MDGYVCLDGYIHGYIHVYMQNNIYHVICSEAAVRSIDIDGFHCLTAALAGPDSFVLSTMTQLATGRSIHVVSQSKYTFTLTRGQWSGDCVI